MRVITLARKPLPKGVSVAENVLRHGTGGLNIDASRITTGDNRARNNHARAKGSVYDNILQRTDSYIDPGGSGRWPSNVILEHRPECRQVGMKKIKGIAGTAAGKMAGHEDETGIYNKGWAGTSRAHEQCGYVDEDGLEEVPAWECSPDCPVRALDDQSGNRPSTWTNTTSQNPSTAKPVSKFRPEQGSYMPQGQLYADEGGASRFFRQVQRKR